MTLLPSSSAPLHPTVDPQAKKQRLDASPALPPTSPLTSSLTPSTSLEATLPLLQRTLAERLAELEKRSGTFAGDPRTKGSAPSDAAGAVVPKTGSLQVLLTQALHTGDEGLFEYCLSSSMAAVFNPGMGGGGGVAVPPALRQTLQRLPAGYLLPLLTRLIGLLQSRPSRALPLLTWLHTLMMTQTAWWLQQPPGVLQPVMGRLMGLLDARIAGYKKMCRLQGKLEVIIAQVQGRRGEGGEEGVEGEVGVGPQLRYIEGRGMVRPEPAEAEEKAEVEGKTAGGKKRRRRRGASASAPKPHIEQETEGEDEMAEDGGEEDEELNGDLDVDASDDD